jgi:hypothetical protein
MAFLTQTMLLGQTKNNQNIGSKEKCQIYHRKLQKIIAT